MSRIVAIYPQNAQFPIKSDDTYTETGKNDPYARKKNKKKVKQELLVKAARCWINKDDKVVIINMSKELKETMIKEAKRRYDESVPSTRD